MLLGTDPVLGTDGTEASELAAAAEAPASAGAADDCVVDGTEDGAAEPISGTAEPVAAGTGALLSDEVKPCIRPESSGEPVG